MAGAIRMKLAMHKFTSKDDNFIITAPTYKILNQATLPAFLKVMEGYGKYHKVDAMFVMHNGGTCYFRTGTDPDSVVGITNVRAIWGDEAGLYSLYFHENIQARASFKQASIIYTTSPYSLNWIYKDYIRPFQRDLLGEDIELVQARSNENPYFPKEEFERKKKTMDPRRFNMVYGGEFHKLEGLVYSCFDETKHVIDPYVFDSKTMVVAGVDWGYTNPAVISVLAVNEHGIFLIHEWYKAQKTIGEVVEQAIKLRNIFDIERFYCDPSSPSNIMEFNKAGLTAVPADNDIRAGVDALYTKIADNKFRVFRGKAPNFLDEVSMYHYKIEEEIKPSQNIKEQLPVKAYDHALDSIRYVVYALHKTDFLNKRRPIVGGTKKATNPNDTRGRLLQVLEKRDFDW